MSSGADPNDDHPPLRLRMHDGRLELADDSMKPGTGVSADLLGEFERLLRRPLRKHDPLRRAAGPQRGVIVDATAGLGTDAVRLAMLGATVIAIERSPVIFQLLADGLRRAQLDDRWREHIGDRLRLLEGDACGLLATISPRPDVVYLDPMHPPKRRSSALPRKQMQVLRRIAGEDADAEVLFQSSRRAAARRVIVKRPDHAPPLAPGVTVSFPGKLVRFDVYVTRNA